MLSIRKAPAGAPMDGPMGNSTNSTDMDMPMPDPADEIPTCEELEVEFCDAFAGEDITDCCLTDCLEPLQAIVVCLVLKTTEVDLSECEIPECPEAPAPAESTPAPAPTPSAATGVASTVASVATAGIAMAML